MKPLILKQDLLAAFHELGMHEGMTVMAHTSLSSMGYVCGGAPTVIEALLETVGKEGTIMMPTQSWKNLDPDVGVHPEVSETDWQIIRDYWPAYDTTQRASMLIASDTLMVENDRLAGQRRLIAPLMREYISPIFSDLLDKAPWYLGIAIGTLVAALLLLTWLIIRIRRLFNPSKKSKSSR